MPGNTAISSGGSFFPAGWNDEKLAGTDTIRSMNLHFGKNAEVDCGLHDQDGGKIYKPFFITDTGIICTRVEFSDENGQNLGGAFSYSFNGQNKAGQISSGESLLLHHDESVTILGRPVGTRYTVTEETVSSWTAAPGREQTGVIFQDGEAIAAFTNAKSYTPSELDETKRPTPNPTPTPIPTVTPSPSPTPGATPVPSVTPSPTHSAIPTPEPMPTAAPPTETPTYPPELPDPNDPDSPEVITIEEGVPKTYVKVWNPETEEWEYIDEEDVPLWGAVPETGEGSSPVFWAALAVVSLGGLSALLMPPRKRRGRKLRKSPLESLIPEDFWSE